MLSPTKSSSAFVPQNSESSNGAPGGFSLIEAMVVVAIVAIMATLAVPGYLEKSSAIRSSRRCRSRTSRRPPSRRRGLGRSRCPRTMRRPECPRGQIVNYVVSSVTVRAGAIDITFGNKANANLKGKILTLRRQSSTMRRSFP
jgi:type IV pilus assembly protein PilA